eukprot:g9881.t1
MKEFLEIVRRAEGEDDGGDAGKRVESLPRTNAEFQTCGLFLTLSGQLESRLGAAVDEAVASDELELDVGGGVRPEAIDRAVARLAASPSFVSVVDTARAEVEQVAGVQTAAAAADAAGAEGAAGSGIANLDTSGNFLRRNVDALSSSDTEREGMHAKKRPARRDDWVGLFDLSGGLDSAGGGFFSPRVDVEAALGQLEAGLEDRCGSAASAVEALGLLAEADPELFQFGNHWPLFLKLARRSLSSMDPAIHAKAMTLHWVMYEKSMGMCAADMCEGVLAHAKELFSSVMHVLSPPSPPHRAPAGSGRGCETSVPVSGNLMVVGDSRISCAAREAKALHGMLVTIHETFQHLPESRVWSIVDSVFFLFGDAITSLKGGHRDSIASERQGGGGGKPFDDEHAESSGDVGGGDPAASPATQLSTSTTPGAEDPSSFLLPAHLLAVAGQVDEWLPGWLRSLPTGRLVRAVNDAGLLGAMAGRCKLGGRVPFHGLHEVRSPDPTVAAAPNGAGGTAPSSAPASARPEPCPPKAAIVRHRLSVSAGSSSSRFSCSAGSGSAAPLGRALWLSAADLERALLVQSVSFLGILVTHCRGTPRPCPRSRGSREGSEGVFSGAEVEGEADEEGGTNRGLERGKEALRALVRCVRSRDSCRAERGIKTRSSPRQPQAVKKLDEASRPVRCVALGYVGQLAKATAGGALTPFTPPIINSLFVPLGGAHSNGEGQADSMSERENNGHGATCGMDAGGRLVDESPAFLQALAEIAGVLLSSRGASAGFFVDEDPEGPEASDALLELSRCTAELARNACRYGGEDVDERRDWGGISPEGRHAHPRPPTASSFSSLGPQDSRRLAVEFACALAPIMGLSPRLRAAGRAALWRYGVPHALAELVAYLGDARPEQWALGGESLHRVSARGGHAAGRSGTGGGSGSGGHRSSREDADLRDRLLSSLVEWARDLVGVSSLRRVGLAGPCAFYLSRELGVQHLDRSTRHECADPQLLAVAMRLALCPEGLSQLLSAGGGGLVDGVQRGLDRLGELTILPELLQSHAVGLPPPHAVAPPRLSGHNVEFGGCARGDVPWRSSGLQLGGGAGDLRCLDLIRRLSVSIALCADSNAADPTAAVQMKRWLRWGLSRVGPPRAGPPPRSRKDFLDAWDDAVMQEDADVAQDVREVALELVTSLAADLTTAVEIEAEWLLAEKLARRKSDEEPAGVRTADDDPGAGGATVSKAVAGSGRVCGDGGAQSVGSSMTCVPNIVEPAALGCARLAVSLTSMGGPNEDRHQLLRKLREAEALAAVDSGSSGYGGSPAAPARTAIGIHIQGMSGVGQFPDDSTSDEDWWDAAGRCAPMVAALLADPQETRRTEAFSLLRKAAAKRSPLCAEGAPPAERAAKDCTSRPGADGGRGGSALEGGLSERGLAAMNRLCFSYARSLGFVDDSRGDQFEAGLKAALAAAAAGSTSPLCPGFDWFAAAAFIASGADTTAASAMLQDLCQHPLRAALVLQRTGKRRAAREELETAGGVAAVRREFLPPATSEGMRPSPGVFPAAAAAAAASTAVGCAGEVDGVTVEFSMSPSPSAGEGVAAEGGSDLPLLVLLGLVEDVLEEELPLLSAALRRSGWAAAPLAGRWMRQSMLCVVDWPGVVGYLALALLRGHDYQVYFVVALFRAAQPRVMEAASRGVDLMPLLVGGEALQDFDLEESLLFMEGLEKRHRSRCLAASQVCLDR